MQELPSQWRLTLATKSVLAEYLHCKIWHTNNHNQLRAGVESHIKQRRKWRERSWTRRNEEKQDMSSKCPITVQCSITHVSLRAGIFLLRSRTVTIRAKTRPRITWRRKVETKTHETKRDVRNDSPRRLFPLQSLAVTCISVPQASVGRWLVFPATASALSVRCLMNYTDNCTQYWA